MVERALGETQKTHPAIAQKGFLECSVRRQFASHLVKMEAAASDLASVSVKVDSMVLCARKKVRVCALVLMELCEGYIYVAMKFLSKTQLVMIRIKCRTF